MKKLSRQGLVALIVSSLLLLVAFQVIWLRKVYDEQVTTLRKDIDHSFRTTVLAMQDSLLEYGFVGLARQSLDSPPILDRRIAPPRASDFGVLDDNKLIQKVEINTKDSSQVLKLRDTILKNTLSFVRKDGMHITVFSDSLNSPELARLIARRFWGKPRRHHPDSAFLLPPFAGIGSFDTAVRIIMRGRDSTRYKEQGRFEFSSETTPHITPKGGMKRIFGQTVETALQQNGKIKATQNIVIKLNLDSLRLDDISVAFKKALLDLGIDLRFRIHRLHQSQLPPPQYQGLMTMPVFAGMPKFNVYVAQVPEYRAYVFRQVLPQFLFSLALLGITATAFGLVFRSLRQQEKLTQLKNDFINNITHELKTPIATVSVAIEALQSFDALKNPSLTQEYLSISKNELSRLAMLVDKVLKISLFEQKELELKYEAVDVAALVAQVMDSMRLQFEKVGTQTSLNTEGVENTIIQADKTHLTSVIYNLLDNALKYGGKNIAVNLTTKNDQIEISISDDGCGIAPDYQEKVFEKFFRVPTGDVHNVKGYGLGLSYVASVVRQHGGSIEVKSELGKGACFMVSLPY